MVLNTNWSSVVISDEISAVISVEISVAGWNIIFHFLGSKTKKSLNIGG